MEDFKFSPIEQDDSDFSFTPEETQPDFSKVSGTDFIGEKGVNDNTLNKLKNFWNNITTFEVKEATPTERTEALDKVVEQVKSGEFSPKELLTESTKSLTRETLSLGKGLTGDALKILGDQLYDYRDLSELNMIDKFDAKMNNVLAGGLIKLGDTINGYIDAGIESELLRPDEEVFKGDFVENPSLTRAVSLAMGVIPSLTYGGLISKATKSTTFGGLALSALDAEDIYFGSREAGKSQKEALTLFGAGTAGTAILEKAGLDAVFDKKMTSLSKSILKSMATEGFTEGTQTVFQNAVKKYGYDESQELLEGAVESIIAGSLGAGIVSTARGGYYKYKNKAKELGINEQESDSLIETVGYEMNQKPEAINALFQDNLNKSLNTLSEKLQTLPEEQKTRITTELNSIYDKTYKDLSKYMPEEQAKSNAALVRNSSFFFADVLGISPQQYMDRYGTKVVKQQFQDFEKRNKPSEYPLDVLVQDIARLKKGVSRKVNKGLRLSQFIKQKGGIKDDRGDIKSMGASVGLLNKNGISLDEATRMAWEAGYIQGTERPEINQLLDLLSDDLGNRPVYAFDDQFNGNDRQYYLELERALDEAGADINKDSIGTIKKKLDDYSLRINKEPELPAYNPELDDFIPFQESLSLAKENARLDDIYPAYEGETIKINGQEKTVYNSNGDRIAKSKEALENFYRWFGDSKVVDEQGRPLVVYHGTNEKFDTFNKEKIGTRTDAGLIGKGFYFHIDRETTQSYGAISMPVYLKANNIFDFNNGKSIKENIKSMGIEPIDEFKNMKEEEKRVAREISDWLKSQGYDGANVWGQYLVFEPNQIKSTSNRGTYSESDNIYLQSAFAGSRVDYDRPSLEAIGSGEGNQAHGWGLYYALNRDVAEYYRETLAEPDISYEYDGDAKLTNAEIRIIGQYGLNKAIQMAERQLDLKIAQGYSESDIEEQKAIVEKLKSVNENNIKKIVKENKGQVHEVDIPENPYLLDEQKLFSEQSDYVKERLEKIFANLPKEYLKEYPKMGIERVKAVDFLGSEVYGALEEAYGSPKEASKILENYGIKGITYDGKQDGRCFVIFNPANVKVLQKFYQGEQAPQGAFANDTIYLFENADESTFAHELFHSWKKQLRNIYEETQSDRVKGILDSVDSWTDSELQRKYNITKRENGYAVVDKRGRVVYDNRGVGFLSDYDAREYAKEELFARGFEQYLKEGKAPNKSLKQAFRNFFMWLKKIYRDAMDLNIQLSPDIKNVFSDILGGTDIDFFLESTPESFIQNRINLGEQREKYLDDIIDKAIANKQQVVKAQVGKKFGDIWTTAMIPLSTRAKRISPKVRNMLRRYEFDLSNELNKKYAQATPFMNIWKSMQEDDKIAFDYALKNDYVKKQLEIVDKYNARKEWESVRGLLEQIYDEAISAGLDINWRPDYFPRKVKDVDGFLSYIHGIPEWSYFEQSIREAGLDGATAEEQAEFLNKYLRGFVKVDILPNKYGSEKERTIDVIDNELNQFYAPSMESLVGYIEGLNSRIVSSKYLGKGENIDESIGGYLTYLLNNNIIEPAQIDEVRDILRARFGQRGVSNRWLANARNYSYMYTMGGINSAITQIEDLSVAMYKAGVWNTITTAFESKRVTRSDLGLNSVSAEFVEQSKSGEALNKLFKLTGLDAIDGFGKETLINAELKKFRKMSDNTLREYLEPIMEDETQATIEDIRNNNISDNVLYLMFSELSDVQPISLSELPEFYNRSGNLRVLYMLKSFAIKRIDIFRNECIDKIKSRDFEQRKEGLQNLFKLSILMIFCGASKDLIIDILYGRQFDLPETVTNNVLGLAGISKFQIYQAKEKGFTGTLKDMVVPPLFAFFDDLFTDTVKVAQGKRKIKDMEVLKGIPLVGRFYYWWIGRGKEKQKKKKKY